MSPWLTFVLGFVAGGMVGSTLLFWRINRISAASEHEPNRDGFEWLP